MPKIKPQSEYRMKIFLMYGEKVHQELVKVKKTEYFLVKTISGPGLVKCMAHLSQRSREQYLSDVCTEMVLRGTLLRNGKSFYLAKTTKQKKHLANEADQ